jgi:ABC-type glycerol-3-phosphate transport system substrate-binding protein
MLLTREEGIMNAHRFTRRRFLSSAAAASTATIFAPYIRTSHAAGSLLVGFWDHWVPSANDALTNLCNEWAAREKVDLKIDYIPSQGNKNLLTIAAESQAKSGHDILAFPTWQPADKARELEPVDDVMKTLLAANGAVPPLIEYLARPEGRWVAVPTAVGSQIKGPCARIDLFKRHVDLDITKMYPAGAAPDKALSENWTWDTFLSAAEKCRKAGFPFGIGLGQTEDSVDTQGALWSSYGAQVVDAKGNITVKSDAVMQVLEYMKKLVPLLPPDVFAWDNASNNKILIAGKSALIMNPPSAWAVAKRDNPKVAEQLWTFPSPRGPKGRYEPYLPYFWGIWKFSKNKAAAKSLILHLSERSAVEKTVAASQGYDIPAFAKLNDFKTWAEEGPPKGTLYHYPPKPGQILSVSAFPAPPKIAVQIYSQAIMTKMVAKYTQGGEPSDKVISWAASELEGFMRT